MSKIKFKKRIVMSDAMLEYHEPEGEFSDEDRARLRDPDDIQRDEDGVSYSRFDRDFDEQANAFMRGPSVIETVTLIKQRAEEELQKLGMPPFDQKIWISADAREVWEPAGDDWTPGYDAENRRFGADGLNYSCAIFDTDYGSPGWKCINLVREAYDFLEAEDPETRENIALHLGRLVERHELHSAFLREVSLAKERRMSGRRAAEKVNNERKEYVDSRLHSMIDLIESKGMSRSAAARLLERQGRGSFDANIQLHKRYQREKN